VSFSNLFPSRQTAPLAAENGSVKLHIFVDWSSVEVFGDAGQTVITDQIFPMSSSDGLALFRTEVGCNETLCFKTTPDLRLADRHCSVVLLEV
jgi:sucrose-6-phosphate hydrolase SacC (GH32 family)